MQRSTYDEILEKVNEAERWMISLGLKIKNTRFDTAKKNFEIINKYYKSNNIDNIDKVIDNEIGIQSMFTCRDFVYIFENLKNFEKKSILKEIIKKSLKGPLLAKDETGRNRGRARDLFFQLELASFLTERGIGVENFDDVQFMFDNYKFHIECKRPFAAKGMKWNSKKAYKQLKKHLIRKNDRGIVAFAVDKVIGKEKDIEDKILITQNKNALLRREDSLINEIIGRYRDLWNKIYIHRDIIGLFLFFKFKFHPKSGILSQRKGLHLYPLHPDINYYPSTNRYLFESLGKELNMRNR